MGESSVVNWSEVKIFGETCLLSLIYSYVAVCRFCVVRCIIVIGFPFLFLIDLLTFFNIISMFYFLVLCVCFQFYVFCGFLYRCV
jgi:hypothetical protein